MRQASAQSKLVKTCELGAFSLERRQFWKWIRMPTITIGANTATAKNGDNGVGEISAITIPDQRSARPILDLLSRGCDHAPYSGALFISISSISRICTTSAATKRCAYSSSAIDLSLTISIKSR